VALPHIAWPAAFKIPAPCNDTIYILAQLRIVRKTKPVDIPPSVWYNSCKAAIIPELWPGWCAGRARSRPDGQWYLSHRFTIV